MMKLSNKQINDAEEALIMLASAFDISEQKMLEIIEDGINLNANTIYGSPNYMSEEHKELLEEMRLVAETGEVHVKH